MEGNELIVNPKIAMPIINYPYNMNSRQCIDIDSDSDSDTSSSNSDDNDKKDKNTQNTDQDGEQQSLQDDIKGQVINLYNADGIQIYNPNLPVGNNIILKNGNLIVGIKYELKQFILIILIGFTLLLIWLIFIFPFYIYGSEFKALSLFIMLIYGLAEYYHILCFLTEPGIIPRNHPVYQTPFGKDLICRLPDHPNIAEQKTCRVCGIDRPFRTYHCIRCNNCVEEFDHFTANCIGKRNRKYFFFFLIYSCLFTWLIILTSFYQIIGLSHHASDLFISLFANFYISAFICLGVFISLITYPLLNKTIFLKNGLALITVFYTITFYLYKESNSSFFINPFGVTMIIIGIQLTIIPSCMLFKQIKLIGIGFTSNQHMNLINYRQAINNEETNSIDNKENNTVTIIEEFPLIKEIPQLTIKEKLKNFKYFLIRQLPPSLLAQIYKN